MERRITHKRGSGRDVAQPGKQRGAKCDRVLDEHLMKESAIFVFGGFAGRIRSPRAFGRWDLLPDHRWWRRGGYQIPFRQLGDWDIQGVTEGIQILWVT